MNKKEGVSCITTHLHVNSTFLTYDVFPAFDEANLPLSWARIIWQDWQINMWQSYKFPVRLAAFILNKIL